MTRNVKMFFLISLFSGIIFPGYSSLSEPENIPYPLLQALPVGEKIVHSPDPLSNYRWKDPRSEDGLEVYPLQPVSISCDKPGNMISGPDAHLTVTGPCNILFDFGQVNAAWFEFDSPEIDGVITMSISEFNEPAVFNAGSQHPVKTATPVRHGDTWRLELNRELYEGVRFGWIHIQSLNKPLQIRSPRLVCQIKPVNYNGRFECSDTLLTRIWYTGAYTVKLNLLEDHFGAILMERSDRHSWTGDAHTSQAASMVAFGNFDFVKQNLRYTSTQYNGIAAYSLYWVLSLVDYYNYTGDIALMKEMLENACSRLDVIYEQYDTDNPLVFYGWDERLGAGFENPAIPEVRYAYRMLCIRSWKEFANSLENLGEHSLALKYQQYAEEKICSLRKNTDWWKPFGIHASADALNALFVTETEAGEIWENTFTDRQQRLSYSPFNQYFILQAMARMDYHREAVTTVDDCWGGQIRYGGTTFFEVFRPSWNDISGPNDAPVNNQCGYTSLTHPWSAGVTKWLSEEVLGIKPTTPGFTTFTVQPWISSRVTWVKGDVPIPNGIISFSLDTESGNLRLIVPASSHATLAVPKAGRSIKKIRLSNGKNIRSTSEDDHYIYFANLPAGNYKGKVEYAGAWPQIPEEPFCYPETRITEDSQTSGDWNGTYGSKGYLFFNYTMQGHESQLPSFVSDIRFDKALNTIWCEDSVDPRVLKTNGNTTGNLGAIYTNDPQPCWQTMTMDIESERGVPFDLSLYFVDFDSEERRSAIEVFDRDTKELLMPVYIVRDYKEGKYVTFPVNSPVRVRINQVRGANAVCNALFFD